MKAPPPQSSTSSGTEPNSQSFFYYLYSAGSEKDPSGSQVSGQAQVPRGALSAYRVTETENGKRVFELLKQSDGSDHVAVPGSVRCYKAHAYWLDTGMDGLIAACENPKGGTFVQGFRVEEPSAKLVPVGESRSVAGQVRRISAPIRSGENSYLPILTDTQLVLLQLDRASGALGAIKSTLESAELQLGRWKWPSGPEFLTFRAFLPDVGTSDTFFVIAQQIRKDDAKPISTTDWHYTLGDARKQFANSSLMARDMFYASDLSFARVARLPSNSASLEWVETQKPIYMDANTLSTDSPEARILATRGSRIFFLPRAYWKTSDLYLVPFRLNADGSVTALQDFEEFEAAKQQELDSVPGCRDAPLTFLTFCARTPIARLNVGSRYSREGLKDTREPWQIWDFRDNGFRLLEQTQAASRLIMVGIGCAGRVVTRAAGEKVKSLEPSFDSGDCAQGGASTASPYGDYALTLGRQGERIPGAGGPTLQTIDPEVREFNEVGRLPSSIVPSFFTF